MREAGQAEFDESITTDNSLAGSNQTWASAPGERPVTSTDDFGMGNRRAVVGADTRRAC